MTTIKVGGIALFLSYNTTGFGAKLKQIRTLMKFTQSAVCNNIQISQDGLRKIENGYVMPRFETLVHLSNIYRTNLFSLLTDYCIIPDLTSLYKKVTRLIEDNKLDELLLLDAELKTLKDSMVDKGIILIDEYEQYKLFNEASILFMKNGNDNLETSKQKIIAALSLSIQNFDISKFKTYKFNDFEIRLLHLYSLAEKRLENYESCLAVLLFLVDNFVFDSKDSDSIRTVILLYFSISYSYHESKDSKNALIYSDLGIRVANDFERMNELHMLYYRKGIAEFELGNANYMDSLKKSVLLLEIQNNQHLAQIYRDVSMNKYGIMIK